jgi:HAD superfamily hydrolase (TIGR01490 family)
MTLAIFDLDNTLIQGDSDLLWGRYLVEHGHIDPSYYEDRHARYYQDYLNGQLNIFDFLSFQLEVLARHDEATLLGWRAEYLVQKIHPIVLPKAEALVGRHRNRGDTLVIITATNRFLTEPIAALFGIANLIATEPEVIDGRYTGRVSGTPAFAAGKVSRLSQWMAGRWTENEERWFYSDSHNDLPLLNTVTHPVAVDPDPTLAAAAAQNCWPIISLR